MGLLLSARCEACGYARDGLRLGGTHAQIEAHDVCHLEVYEAPCCRALQSVELFLGAPLPTPACEGCGQTFSVTPERRYRISTLKGEVLGGHACPRCRAAALSFARAGTFL